MPNLNKVMLIGHLGRDWEVRSVGSDNTVASTSMAVTRKSKNKDETTWVDLTAWGKQAELLNQYTSKGSAVFIEGRLTLDQWEDKDGGKRSKLKVTVENFQFLNGNGGNDEQPRRQRGGASSVAVDPDDPPF